MKRTYEKGEYGFDLSFLKTHLNPVELNNGEARILLVPEFQGRVMTSTSSGLKGFSYGWINYDLIEKEERQPHINPYGGEERLWLGPEGGQFSIFFKGEDPFDFSHWQTPDCLDTEAFNLVQQNEKSVSFSKKMTLWNYKGTKFQLEAFRKVMILPTDEIEKRLEMKLPSSVKTVAYSSENEIKNIGREEWCRQHGTLSIWMLGMLNPSPKVTIVIPYKTNENKTKIKSDYFGVIPNDRLQIERNTVFLKADGAYRSKIGIPPSIALPILGSFDEQNGVLTILQCSIDEEAKEYVNSAWEIQENPFSGDVINAYNDGTVEDGSQMGPFYELETSSKAAFLKSGEILQHQQTTMHFEGTEDDLDLISRKILGISILKIKSIFS